MKSIGNFNFYKFYIYEIRKMYILHKIISMRDLPVPRSLFRGVRLFFRTDL